MKLNRIKALRRFFACNKTKLYGGETMANYKKTAKTIVMVIILSFMAKFMGFLRDALIGSNFGANNESDAYLIALNCTSIVFVSIGSALITGVIPTLISLMKKSKEEAFKFVNNLLNILISISIIVSLIGINFSEEIMQGVASGFSSEKIQLSALLARIMYPVLICIVITYVFVAILQSMEQFKVTSLISFPANTIMILYLIFLSKTYGVKGLAVINLVGWILQFIVQIPFLYKHGYRYSFKINFNDPNLKKVFKLLIPMIVVASSIQVNILIDEKYASLLKEGSISYIHYGNTLYQAIVTTTILGISMVVFPKFAKMSEELQDEVYAANVSKVIGVVVYILIPVMVGIVVLRNEIIGIVYERGAFLSKDTYKAAGVFAAYSLGALFMGIQDLVNKGFYAKENVISPMKASIVGAICNISLNIITIKKFGVMGLAMSTSLSMLIATLVLIYEFTKKLHRLKVKELKETFIKSMATAFVMFAVIYLMKFGINTFLVKNSLLYKILVVGIITTTGIITYSLVSLKLKIREAIQIYEDFFKYRLETLIKRK